MKKKIQNIIVLSIIFFGLYSCEKIADEYNNPSEDYFPLAIGNQWKYSSDVTKEIISDTVINGNTYFMMVHMNPLYDCGSSYKKCIIPPEYYRQSNGKVYQLKRDHSDESLMFDLTASEGDDWKHTDYSTEEWTVTIVDRQEKVKLNNKEIRKCFRFDFDIELAADDEHTKILAPGLGLIIDYSYAWGFGDTLSYAIIDGKKYEF